MKGPWGAALAVAVLAAPGLARADLHPFDAPPTLGTRPIVVLSEGLALTGPRPAGLLRATGELPLVRVPVVLTGTWLAGVGAGQGLAPRPVTGTLAVGGRAVWGSPMGFAFAGGLEVGVPTRLRGADGLGDDGVRSAYRGASDALVPLAGADADLLWPRAALVRPSVALRLVRGPYALQARQAIALGVDPRDVTRSRVTASLAVAVTWAATERLAVGAEVAEHYLVGGTEPTDDAHRARVVATVHLRHRTLPAAPALGLTFAAGSDVAPPTFAVRIAGEFGLPAGHDAISEPR